MFVAHGFLWIYPLLCDCRGVLPPSPPLRVCARVRVCAVEGLRGPLKLLCRGEGVSTQFGDL